MHLKVNRTIAEEEAALLRVAYPDARCELNFDNPYQLLVATVLSAQTTDARVNQVTPELFALAPGPEELAAISLERLESLLRPLGMFRRRALALHGLGLGLVEEFDGVVPNSREELVSLPGVGRKTANVVLGNCFGQQEITVDTHVARVTGRLGWHTGGTPRAIEKQLWELLPEAPWTQLCHEIIFHGRRVCHARRPNCRACVLAEFCPSVDIADGDE